MKVAVLGGMGLMAEAALFDLLRQSHVKAVIVADVNLSRREAVAAKLPRGKKVNFIQIDLRNTANAVRVLKNCDVVINAAWYEFNLAAMEIAAKLRAHYVDLGGLYHMTLKQLKRRREFERLGILGVLGMGSTPGIANVVAAELGESFDRIDSVGIFDASHDPALGASYLPPFSIRTMLDEFEMPAPILENGRIKMVPAHTEVEELDFRSPIGRCRAGAVIHSELATLPQYFKKKGVQKMAFKIVYPDTVKNQLRILSGMGFSRKEPLKVNGTSCSPRSFIGALAQHEAAKPASKPHDFEILRIQIKGRAGNLPLTRSFDIEMRPEKHVSAGAAGVGYAASIAASLLFHRRTTVQSGVYAPESILDRTAFINELKRRKVFKIIERTERPLARTNEGVS